jgi:hypothetical protein
MDRRLGGAQSRFGRGGEAKKIPSVSGIEPLSSIPESGVGL